MDALSIILGSIPLLISAMEHYAEGIRTMKNMKDFEVLFTDLLADFGTAGTLYHNSCYEILQRGDFTEMKINQLINEQQQHQWADPEVQQYLRKHLGQDCDVYLKSVKKLHDRIRLLGRKLKLQENTLKPCWILPDDKVDVKAREKYFSSWRRIVGGFQYKKFEELVQKIIADINQLQKLGSSATALEPIRVQKRHQSALMYWKTFRDHAKKLFDCLSSQFHPCSCRAIHQANLQLEVPKEPEYEMEGEIMHFAFQFTFQKTALPCATVPPWDWRDVEIEVHEGSVLPASLNTTHRRVQWAATAQNTPSLIVSSFPQTPTCASVSSSASRVDAARKINDLCKELAGSSKHDFHLKFQDDNFWPNRSMIQRLSQCYPLDPAPLHEIVHPPNAFTLSPKERSTLALSLAFAVLRLHDTPWLDTNWNIKDIYAHRMNLAQQQSIPYIVQLYVSRIFSATTTPASSPLSAQSSSPASPPPNAIPQRPHRRCIPNEMVFALGIALLELSYGRPLSTFQLPKDLNPTTNQPDEFTEIETARRLADGLFSRETDNFSWATKRCVTCTFESRVIDLEDEEFREKFYAGVITPLREDYDHLMGRKVRVP